MLLVHVQMEGRIDGQNARNGFLEAEIKVLDKKIASQDDLIIIVVGFGLKKGSTNVIKIHRVGHDD